MIISIASGKGGTGKTTIASSLALSIPDSLQFLDCDVEEPNAHFFLKPDIQTIKKVSIPVPEIDEERCDFCGKCAQVCAYNALAVLRDKVMVFSQLCHACGGCTLLCPKEAISEVDREIGVIEVGKNQQLQFIHGKLNIGEAMAPPLIKEVKRHINPTRTVIIDAPPGTSCPVIEAVKGSDFCILVTEPTPFGLNDLVLAVEVLRKLTIPFGVMINRFDIGDKEVEGYCVKEDIDILMCIPFKREIAFAYSEGTALVEALPQYKKDFLNVYKKIKGKFS